MRYQAIKLHDQAHIRTITERGGHHFLSRRYTRIERFIHTLECTVLAVSALQQAWSLLQGSCGRLLRYVVIGRLAYDLAILEDDTALAMLADTQLAAGVSWYVDRYQALALLDTSLQQLQDVLHASRQCRTQWRVSVEEASQSAAADCVRIGHLVMQSAGDNGNFHLSISELTMCRGRRYCVTGSSGKSLLLATIGGVACSPHITTSGSVSVPAGWRSIVVSQQLYLPKDAQLGEAIAFPSELTIAAARGACSAAFTLDDIAALLRQCDIDAPHSHTSRQQSAGTGAGAGASVADMLTTKHVDWETRLSSEQKRKIAVLSAVMQQPDMLFLDDAFSGLTQPAVSLLQTLIQRYLPRSLVLVVDQQAQLAHSLRNEYNGGARGRWGPGRCSDVYFARIHVSGGTCTVTALCEEHTTSVRSRCSSTMQARPGEVAHGSNESERVGQAVRSRKRRIQTQSAEHTV